MLTPEEHWKQVKALFERALEQGPVDSSVWLDDAAAWPTSASVPRCCRSSAIAASPAPFWPIRSPIACRTSWRTITAPARAGRRKVHHRSRTRPRGHGSGIPRHRTAAGPTGGTEGAATGIGTRSGVPRTVPPRSKGGRASSTHPGICTIYAFEEIDGESVPRLGVSGRSDVAVEMDARGTPRPTVDRSRRTARGSGVRALQRASTGASRIATSSPKTSCARATGV